MRAVAVLLSVTMLSGCFPHDPHARTITKITEGGIVVAGIGILAVSQSAADCRPLITGAHDPNCRSNANTIGTIGFGLILVGLVGFIATVSTTPDDKKSPPLQDIKAPPAEPAKPPPQTTVTPPAPAPAPNSASAPN
jgi:hypothetical protein